MRLDGRLFQGGESVSGRAGLLYLGKVAAVQEERGLLTVEQEWFRALGRDRVREFLVKEHAEITLVPRGQHVRLADLELGDSVEIRYTIEWGANVVQSVVVRKPAAVTRLPAMASARRLAINEMAGLVESMTVNHVLNGYPQTHPVFEELAVSPEFEGHDSLEEIAWRRGLDGRELLARLEMVMTRLRRVTDGYIEDLGGAAIDTGRA